MAAQLRFAKLHLNKPKDFWKNVLWTDQTKVEMFGHNAYQHKHLIPTVKHGGGELMRQIYNRMCEKEKNRGVAMVQSKSRPQPD